MGEEDKMRQLMESKLQNYVLPVPEDVWGRIERLLMGTPTIQKKRNNIFICYVLLLLDQGIIPVQAAKKEETRPQADMQRIKKRKK